jgi:lambda repressor-like predicted transcriptional regulator
MTVHYWLLALTIYVGYFKSGRSGRPVSVRTDVSRAVIAQCMEEDRRWSLKELERHTGIDQATVHRILRKYLHMRKIAAKWVPHELNEVQKWARYEASRVNLERYEIEGDNFLKRIISINETWARAYEIKIPPRISPTFSESKFIFYFPYNSVNLLIMMTFHFLPF